MHAPPPQIAIPNVEGDPVRQMLAPMRNLSLYHWREWGRLTEETERAGAMRRALASEMIGRELVSLGDLTEAEMVRVGERIYEKWPECIGR